MQKFIPSKKLLDEIKRMAETGITYKEAKECFEKNFLEESLMKHKYKRYQTADNLKIHRNTLLYLTKKYGL